MSDEHSSEPLHEQKEWLRVTLASIGDAVITTDTSGLVTFLNPVAEAVTGWKLEEATGTPLETVFQIVNEDSRCTVENPATRALRDGVVVGLANHTILISRAGNERPIDDSAAPIRNQKGEVAGAVLVFRDITERRKSELAQRESEERFRLLVEGTRDYAIFMLDPGGYIVSWNTGAERIKGYKREEIIGRHFSCFYPTEAIEKGWPEHELKVAGETGRFEDEGWRLRKDGSLFWANVIITALRDEQGRLRGFSKITRDLTERRELERVKLQAELIQDLNRRKDEFLAMLSHELRNPLAPIVNAVHLLRLRKCEDPIQEQAELLIERQVDHLTRLINDLLEVTRINTGRIRLQREYMDLRPVVERALDTVRSQLVQRRQELSVSLTSEPVLVFADATRIEQVAVNLLTNAIKYTHEGGRITLTLQRENSDARLSVQDTGVGIAAEFIPRMFELFVQAERSVEHSQGGLGVGLTVVRRVVELHGGRVEAHSAGIGHGSEFIVWLPLESPPSQASDEVKPVERGQQHLRMLVVDDNKDTAESTAILLRAMGHDARVAFSGTAAVELALAYRPDAVLLDLGLPEIDGYEVARRLRQQADFKNVPIVAVSGYGQDIDKQRSEAAGFDGHLVKPAKIEQIEEMLSRLLRQRSGARQGAG